MRRNIFPRIGGGKKKKAIEPEGCREGGKVTEHSRTFALSIYSGKKGKCEGLAVRTVIEVGKRGVAGTEFHEKKKKSENRFCHIPMRFLGKDMRSESGGAGEKSTARRKRVVNLTRERRGKGARVDDTLGKRGALHAPKNQKNVCVKKKKMAGRELCKDRKKKVFRLDRCVRARAKKKKKRRPRTDANFFSRPTLRKKKKRKAGWRGSAEEKERSASRSPPRLQPKKRLTREKKSPRPSGPPSRKNTKGGKKKWRHAIHRKEKRAPPDFQRLGMVWGEKGAKRVSPTSRADPKRKRSRKYVRGQDLRKKKKKMNRPGFTPWLFLERRGKKKRANPLIPKVPLGKGGHPGMTLCVSERGKEDQQAKEAFILSTMEEKRLLECTTASAGKKREKKAPRDHPNHNKKRKEGKSRRFRPGSAPRGQASKKKKKGKQTAPGQTAGGGEKKEKMSTKEGKLFFALREERGEWRNHIKRQVKREIPESLEDSGGEGVARSLAKKHQCPSPFRSRQKEKPT